MRKIEKSCTSEDVLHVLKKRNAQGLVIENKWKQRTYYCLDPTLRATSPKDEATEFNLCHSKFGKPRTVLGSIDADSNQDKENRPTSNAPSKGNQDKENQTPNSTAGASGVSTSKSLSSTPEKKTPVARLPLDFDDESTKKDGFRGIDNYCCTGCNEKFIFSTSEDVKTPIVAKSKKYSRTQAQVNVSIPTSLKCAGINYQQSLEIFGEAGIQAPSKNNLVDEMKKVETAILADVQEQILKNRRRLIQAIKADPAFDETTEIVTWHGDDGSQRKTLKIRAAMDACGATRAYNNNNTGTQSAAMVISHELSLPIAYKVARTGCMKCLKAVHKAIREGQQDPFLAKHDGECTSNSIHGPSTAEEYMLEDMGRDLLLDSDGNYLGDDTALFICSPTSDGDSTGANRLIQNQFEIIGEEARGESEQIPCVTHVGKNLNKAFYTLRKKDASFRGIGGLENGRISSIGWDIKRHLKDLKVASWDQKRAPSEEEVLETERKIINVIPHHCGDHTGCKDPEQCGFIKVKLDNGFDLTATLTPEQHEELEQEVAEKGYSRFQYRLQLNKKGLIRALHEVTFRFNKTSIPKLARCYNTCQVESIWAQVVKYSSGKRLNQNYSELWEVGVGTAILAKSEPKDYIRSINTSLGLSETETQATFRAQREKQRIGKKRRAAQEADRNVAKMGKVVKSRLRGKVKAKKEYEYKPEKVSPGETIALVDPGKKKIRRKLPCKNCLQVGHTASKCNFSPFTKKDDQIIDPVWFVGDNENLI